MPVRSSTSCWSPDTPNATATTWPPSAGCVTPGVLSRRLRIDHAPPSDEVLLWLPDAVCGAVGDDLCGHPTHLHAMKDRVEIIEIELA